MEATEFFHFHQGFLCHGGGLVAELKLFHHLGWARTGAGTEQKDGEKTIEAVHLSESTSVEAGFKEQEFASSFSQPQSAYTQESYLGKSAGKRRI